MKKIIEANDLLSLADEILTQVEMLELLDDDEGDDIDFFTPQLRQAAEDLKELAEASAPAPITQEDEG